MSFSVGSGRGNSGCGFLIFVFIIIAALGRCSEKSSDDIKNESVNYKEIKISASELYRNICATDVTDDGVDYYFNRALDNTWLTQKVIVNSLSNGTLDASSTFNKKLNFSVEMEQSKPLRVGDTVKVKFAPVSADKYSCQISGKVGSYQ